MSDPRPRLSLCLIAKDEQRNLPRCLDSVEGIVDELVVTDTGSTDRTVEIASQAGARVEAFSWCDDFAAAYNHAFDRVTGDWVLMLDADEELAPGQKEKIRRLIERDDAFAYSVLRQDFRGAKFREDGYTEMLQLRLWRNHPRARYVGRIHQQFAVPLDELAKEQGRQVEASDLRLRHYGYLGEDGRPKLLRAARLLGLELDERPGCFYYLVELALTQLALGEECGLETLSDAAAMVASGAQPIDPGSGSLALMIEKVIAMPTLPKGFPLSHQRAEQIAEQAFPDAVPLLWQRALRAFAAGRFGESARLLETILDLAQRDAYSRLCSFDPRIMQGDAVLNLAVCYARQAKPKKAIPLLERLAEDPAYAEAAKQNLAALRGLSRGR